MRTLIIAALLCSATGYASQTNTYTVDSSGVVTVDRDMRQSDLKISYDSDMYEGKGLFQHLKGWFE